MAEFQARFSSPALAGFRVSLSMLREGGVGMKLAGTRALSQDELDELVSGLGDRGVRRIDARD